MIRSLFLAALLCGPVAPASAQDIFDRFEGSLWAFPERKGMQCHENPHTITFNADRTQSFFDWDRLMTTYENKLAQHATYDVIDYDETSITLYLHGESRTTDSGSPVVWILRFPDDDTYCWDRTDWTPPLCTHLHVRCKLPGLTS